MTCSNIGTAANGNSLIGCFFVNNSVNVYITNVTGSSNPLDHDIIECNRCPNFGRCYVCMEQIFRRCTVFRGCGKQRCKSRVLFCDCGRGIWCNQCQFVCRICGLAVRQYLLKCTELVSNINVIHQSDCANPDVTQSDRKLHDHCVAHRHRQCHGHIHDFKERRRPNCQEMFSVLHRLQAHLGQDQRTRNWVSCGLQRRNLRSTTQRRDRNHPRLLPTMFALLPIECIFFIVINKSDVFLWFRDSECSCLRVSCDGVFFRNRFERKHLLYKQFKRIQDHIYDVPHILNDWNVLYRSSVFNDCRFFK